MSISAVISQIGISEILIMRMPVAMMLIITPIVAPLIVGIENAIAAWTSAALEEGKRMRAVVDKAIHFMLAVSLQASNTEMNGRVEGDGQ